eukprot:TRINITY_DN11197_c0_g1_i1.p1 TRINITY_DN11197_c0_g1~~TRINITY_DN11197_c0_g1_i1.p1  ORF type:complete len:490 (+),score=83.76 TRINITY_DN11197_c0_g1_i1:38-1507(+)
MPMGASFLLSLFLGCVLGSVDVRYFSNDSNGLDVIDINEFAYASNLWLSTMNSTDVMDFYFIADKSSPNFYTASFSTKSGTFWTTGDSPLTSEASPFLSFSVSGNGKNIIGPAYPDAYSLAASFVVQTVYMSDNGPVVKEFATAGLSFLSALMDPVVDNGRSFVYLAATTSSGQYPFVVVRAQMTPDSPNPAFSFDPVNDVLSVPFDPQCFDKFDEVHHPTLKLTSTSLYVIVPGRCAVFAEIVLPTNPLVRFSTVVPNPAYPLKSELNNSYVSSAVFDVSNPVVFYTVKMFDFAKVTLNSFDFANPTIKTSLDISADLTEFDPLVVIGVEPKSVPYGKYLFLIASGANFIERYEVTPDNNFLSKTKAYLTPYVNQISSAFYSRPYLYFVTYEPDSKLARIHYTNFCSSDCGVNEYCDAAFCVCLDGFIRNSLSEAKQCESIDLYRAQIQLRDTEGASAALGVLFAFSLLTAIAGWLLFLKSSRNPTVV